MTFTPCIDPARLAELRIEAHKSLTARMAVLDSIGIGIEGEDLAVTPGSIERLLFGEPEQAVAEESSQETSGSVKVGDKVSAREAAGLPVGSVVAIDNYSAITKRGEGWHWPRDGRVRSNDAMASSFFGTPLVVLRIGGTA